jgi:hypothetical protein
MGVSIERIIFLLNEEFSIQVWPTALSIMVSFLSAITLLGTPSEVYMFGTMYLYQGERLIDFEEKYM